MANPFIARFSSNCDSCGNRMEEGEDKVFADDGDFICIECAEKQGKICPACGSFKKPEYDECFSCHEDDEEMNEPDVPVSDDDIF